jgi:hypothetical protein
VHRLTAWSGTQSVHSVGMALSSRASHDRSDRRDSTADAWPSPPLYTDSTTEPWRTTKQRRLRRRLRGRRRTHDESVCARERGKEMPPDTTMELSHDQRRKLESSRPRSDCRLGLSVWRQSGSYVSVFPRPTGSENLCDRVENSDDRLPAKTRVESWIDSDGF